MSTASLSYIASRGWTKLVVLCAAFLCMATLQSPSHAYADDKADVTKFANDLGNQAIEVLMDKDLPKDARRKKLEDLFEQNVDINWIGKFVLGRYWRNATEEQQKQYLANYKTFLIKNYTSNLTDFDKADFEVTKVEPEERGGQVVTMSLKRPNAEDAVVSYTVRKNDKGKYNVYDIVVEGVSMITTQRSEFSSVASQKGLDYLIDELGNRGRDSSKN